MIAWKMKLRTVIAD